MGYGRIIDGDDIDGYLSGAGGASGVNHLIYEAVESEEILRRCVGEGSICGECDGAIFWLDR